jgi:hypothetical protein
MLMKRSIYSKTSKPHLVPEIPIYRELAFNDPLAKSETSYFSETLGSAKRLESVG